MKIADVIPNKGLIYKTSCTFWIYDSQSLKCIENALKYGKDMDKIRQISTNMQTYSITVIYSNKNNNFKQG